MRPKRIFRRVQRNQFDAIFLCFLSVCLSLILSMFFDEIPSGDWAVHLLLDPEKKKKQKNVQTHLYRVYRRWWERSDCTRVSNNATFFSRLLLLDRGELSTGTRRRLNLRVVNVRNPSNVVSARLHVSRVFPPVGVVVGTANAILSGVPVRKHPRLPFANVYSTIL